MQDEQISMLTVAEVTLVAGVTAARVRHEAVDARAVHAVVRHAIIDVVLAVLARVAVDAVAVVAARLAHARTATVQARHARRVL